MDNVRHILIVESKYPRFESGISIDLQCKFYMIIAYFICLVLINLLTIFLVRIYCVFSFLLPYKIVWSSDMMLNIKILSVHIEMCYINVFGCDTTVWNVIHIHVLRSHTWQFICFDSVFIRFVLLCWIAKQNSITLVTFVGD